MKNLLDLEQLNFTQLHSATDDSTYENWQVWSKESDNRPPIIVYSKRDILYDLSNKLLEFMQIKTEKISTKELFSILDSEFLCCTSQKARSKIGSVVSPDKKIRTLDTSDLQRLLRVYFDYHRLMDGEGSIVEQYRLYAPSVEQVINSGAMGRDDLEAMFAVFTRTAELEKIQVLFRQYCFQLGISAKASTVYSSQSVKKLLYRLVTSVKQPAARASADDLLKIIIPVSINESESVQTMVIS